jgi:hypothetical protein
MMLPSSPLKGKTEKDERISVVLPRKRFKEQDDLSKGIYFLHGPLDKNETKALAAR